MNQYHEDDSGEPEPSVPPGRDISGSIRRRAWIAGLLVALAAVGGAWALSSPVGSSPDDDFHLASIWCGALAPDELCQPTQRATDSSGDGLAKLGNGVRGVRIPGEIGPGALCYVFDATKSAACQADIDPALTESRANGGLYPDGFYQLLGIFASDDTGRSVVLMRLASFTMAMGLIVGALAVARPSTRRAYFLAVLATSVPLGLFLFSSTNPSGLASASMGATFVCAVGFLRSRNLRELRATAVMGVLAAAAGLSARSDAGLYLAAVCACALLFERAWRRPLRRRAAAVVVTGLVGLAWLTLSTQTSAAADGISGQSLDRPWTAVLWTNIINLPSLWAGSLGWNWGLGWLDTRLPETTGLGMVFVAAGLLFWGLGDARAAKLASGTVAVLAITAAPLWLLSADGEVVGETVQPRYLLPMLPVILTIALLPNHRKFLRLTRVQLGVVATIVCIAQSLALHTNIRRYVSGQDRQGLNLNSNVEWWWSNAWSPMAVWMIGTIAFAAVVVIGMTKGTDLLRLASAERDVEADRSATQDQDVLPVERDGEVAGPGSESNRPTELEAGRFDERAE